MLKHDELFRKYKKIWDKARSIIKNNFDSEPVH